MVRDVPGKDNLRESSILRENLGSGHRVGTPTPETLDMSQGSQSSKMMVDAENRKRRDRETGDFEDVESESETPVPTEKAPPQGEARQTLTLNDLLEAINQSKFETRAGFKELKGEVGTATREAREAKIQAAKATTLSQETKKTVESLEKRVENLEKGGIPTPPPGLSQPAGPPRASSQRDWDRLGGDGGNTAIVSGFHEWSDSEERKTEWEEIKAKMDTHLAEQIEETIVPVPPGRAVIIKIKTGATVEATRAKMVEWTRKFKEAKYTIQSNEDREPRTFVANPSKPFDMRQRDAKFWGVVDGFRAIAGEENRNKFRFDLSNGRIVYERKLLAVRDTNSEAPSPRMTEINQIWPDVTREHINDKIAEAKAKRDPTRSGR